MYGAVAMGSGTTVSSCYLSASGGAEITSSGFGGAVVTGSGSYLLGFSDSSSGTGIELTCTQISIGVVSGISGGGGG